MGGGINWSGSHQGFPAGAAHGDALGCRRAVRTPDKEKHLLDFQKLQLKEAHRTREWKAGWFDLLLSPEADWWHRVRPRRWSVLSPINFSQVGAGWRERILCRRSCGQGFSWSFQKSLKEMLRRGVVAAKGSEPRSSAVESFENYVHEGALLSVGSSAKEFCRMSSFDTYCHIFTSGILVFSLCRAKTRKIHQWCLGNFLSECFAGIFFERRNIVKPLFISTFIVCLHLLMH